jgi:hypothetical protein
MFHFNRFDHRAKHVLEFNVDVLILDLSLLFQAFLQKYFTSITNPLEVKPIEHSAYALGDSLLLMINLIINNSPSFHLLKLCLRCESLQPEQ